MSTERMKNRISRVVSATKAKVRRERIAELESSLKSKSTDKDDGKGSKPKQTASDKYKKDKVQPKVKGDKKNSKLDKSTGEASPVGYPFSGDTEGGLGKGAPKKDSKKSKQTALNDAKKKAKELSSDMPELKSTPKPKLSSAESREWRKAKIAELKTALLPGQASDDEMDTEELSEKDMIGVQRPGDAAKQQRMPAVKVLEKAQAILPVVTQQLQQANDMLEEAVVGNNLQKIKGALAFMLTKVQELTKGQIVPLGATIRKLMSQLSPKQASSAKYASVTQSSHLLSKLDDELSRSQHLMRMAANQIKL